MIHILIPTTKERRGRLAECLAALQENSDYPYAVTIYENTDGGCVKANLKLIADLKDEALVLVLNDDMLPQAGWLKVLVEKYQAAFPNGDGLAYPDDTINHESLATIWLCTAGYMREYYHAGYIHNYGDTELTDISRKRGKLLYVPESVVIHKHWSVGAPQDETYRLQSATWQHDHNLYLSRQ